MAGSAGAQLSPLLAKPARPAPCTEASRYPAPACAGPPGQRVCARPHAILASRGQSAISRSSPHGAAQALTFAAAHSSSARVRGGFGLFERATAAAGAARRSTPRAARRPRRSALLLLLPLTRGRPRRLCRTSVVGARAAAAILIACPRCGTSRSGAAAAEPAPMRHSQGKGSSFDTLAPLDSSRDRRGCAVARARGVRTVAELAEREDGMEVLHCTFTARTAAHHTRARAVLQRYPTLAAYHWSCGAPAVFGFLGSLVGRPGRPRRTDCVKHHAVSFVGAPTLRALAPTCAPPEGAARRGRCEL